jgi:hypothetical protein
VLHSPCNTLSANALFFQALQNTPAHSMEHGCNTERAICSAHVHAAPIAVPTLSCDYLDAIWGLGMAKLSLTAALLVCTSVSARAGFFTGNEIYDFCTASPPFARGYILGVADLNDVNFGIIDPSTGKPVVPERYICIPSGAVAQQAMDIARKYLGDHPESRQQSAPKLIYQALLEAWRCAGK